MAEPLELQLAAWRRPFQGVQTLFALLLAGGLVGCVVVLGAVKLVEIESQVVVRLLFVVAVLATVVVPVWIDHRKWPAATLRLHEGRITYEGDAARRIDAPISDLLFTYGTREVCSIHLRGGKKLVVHRARVSMSLAALDRTLFEHLSAYGPAQLDTRDLAAYNERGMKAFRQTMALRLVIGLGVSLGFLALMRAVLPHPH